MEDRTASDGDTDDAPRGRGVLSAVLLGVPVLAAIVLVALPVAAALWRAAGEATIDTDGRTLGADVLLPAIARTLATTAIIATLATLVAIPAGWMLRGTGRRERRLGAFVLVPMLLPSYMAYCAWTLLRAPRTPLGDWLADAPAWVSDWAGPVFGVWGMMLWSWPLAALVIGAAARRIDQSLLDVLELEGASRGRRLLVVARMLRPGLLAAVLLVMMVMMGSMVALDASRLVTYSVVLLRWTNEHPSDVPVWRASWPLAVVALGATLVLLRLTGAESGSTGLEMPSPRSGRRRWGLLGWTLLVWGLSVAVPGVLFLLSLREPPHAATLATIRQFVWGFWHNTGGAVWSSVGEAARVGAVALVVSGCAWYGASRGRGSRRLIAVCAAMLTFTGLLPGVLVGTAMRRGTDMTIPAIGNSSWLVVAAHLTRFSFVGMLLALWLAGREGREERELRQIDGAMSPRGFVHSCLARHWGVLVGGALATAILAFHEIEATVVTWPPGMRSLSQEMLDAIHFARDERMGAAGVNLLGVGIILAYVAGWLMMGRGEESTPKNPLG